MVLKPHTFRGPEFAPCAARAAGAEPVLMLLKSMYDSDTSVTLSSRAFQLPWSQQQSPRESKQERTVSISTESVRQRVSSREYAPQSCLSQSYHGRVHRDTSHSAPVPASELNSPPARQLRDKRTVLALSPAHGDAPYIPQAAARVNIPSPRGWSRLEPSARASSSYPASSARCADRARALLVPMSTHRVEFLRDLRERTQRKSGEMLHIRHTVRESLEAWVSARTPELRRACVASRTRTRTRMQSADKPVSARVEAEWACVIPAA
ncbi:hypothetical protein DFH07DRAFT_972220 [Mycena maculata]|uniref:Uncharacterized protein n=1 Tax=Mycena maculata TaxID=230809 RepID=A0AAD7MKS3_9AGAR|nr:hypothetical protein DFH07DRAFT_972220 [Mycena maculata]